MNAFVLRAGAALVAASSFVGANAYVVEHPKNPAAPLQPRTTGDVVLREKASASPAPSASGKPIPTTPARATPRPTGRPLPQITLQPGVRATEIPGLTFTHVS